MQTSLKTKSLIRKCLLIATWIIVAISAQTQTLYDIRWNLNGIDYAGFMIYFNEEDIYMRVGYQYGNGYNLVHSEYQYTVDYQQDGVTLFEGLETQYVQQTTDGSYQPFHFFWAWDDEDASWFGPLAIDAYNLEQDNFDAVVEVAMIELDPMKLTEEYLQWFYLPSDPDYYTLLSASQPNTETPTYAGEVPTLHFLMIANTLIPDIGPSTNLDLHNASNEFEGIASALSMGFTKTLVSDKNFSKDQVTATLNAFQPAPNDVVVVMYSGHGFRFSDQGEIYPQLDLRYNEYQEFGPQSCLNLKEVYDAILSKGARLNLIIGDCCNNDIGVPKQMGSGFLAARSAVNASIPKLQALFLESSGSIIAAGAQEGQSSWGSNNMGGFFTNSLIGSIRDEVSKLKPDDEPKWEDILVKAKASTEMKSQMCSDCKLQNPIYEANIN